ncbi:alpha/beta fold hydrolase [Microbacterium esteraromaticum]|uniref:Alpha/beta fold hydrolase n=1 Tax=Microbacterium esteraromaticum TaxID=57043 RepID=A0A7D8ABG5_9MICO|nr:alpha/beta fold hydrolase [Microbacterium esteraromaticum]QMU97261.1 alpha/beta fold hydrolase [Microbacterium esteraromaticum]
MLAERDRFDVHPAEPSGTGVLLLAGSSGRLETARAELLAAHGARVRAMRWFGGEGQRPAPHEVPIELFAEQLDRLRRECDRVVVFGTSFGAEAALLTATVSPVDAVIAVAPTSVVWAGAHDGAWSSHWTLAGEPVPFVPFMDGWIPDADPPAFRELYASSLQHFAERASAARIAVERIGGEVLLIVGGDDQVWPSDLFAREIVAARRPAGLMTTVIGHPDAGHRLLLPGEEPASGGVHMERGGTAAADAELGERAWPEILRVLGAHG